MASSSVQLHKSGSDTLPAPISETRDDAHKGYTPSFKGPPNSYPACFRRLDFKVDNTPLSESKRKDFLSAVRGHVNTSDHRYLRPAENEAAFSTMITEFLAEHGEKYWGASNRSHLEEQDPSKGFLYPRDATPKSNLTKGVRMFFCCKANSCVRFKEKSLGVDWTTKHLDFTAFTGNKADAPSKIAQMQSKETSEESDDEAIDWNVFTDPVETKTRLRPLPRTTKWTGEAVDDDSEDGGNKGPSGKPKTKRPHHGILMNDKRDEEGGDENQGAPLRKPKSKQHRAEDDMRGDNIIKKGIAHKKKPTSHPVRLSAPDLSIRPTETTKKGRKRHAAQSFGVPPLASSSDSDKPLQKKSQKLKPVTPPESQVASRTPTALQSRHIIDLEDDTGFTQNEQLPAADKARKPTNESVEVANPGIKAEPLSADVISRTFLRVSADNMPTRGPIRVPLSFCKTSERLFTSLMSERKIPHDLRKRVSDMTATFTWNKESIGLRKGRSDDWTYFCDSIRKAWEKESHRFAEGCYVDMIIHVDED